MSDTLLEIVQFGILALVVVYANFVDKRRASRALLFFILVFLSGLFVYRYAFEPDEVAALPDGTVLPIRVIAVFTAGLAIATLVPGFRHWIARIFPKRTIDFNNQMPVGFDPDSMVHTTALIYCLYLLSHTALDFIAVGGLSGLAQDFTGVTPNQLWGDLAIWLIFATLGVGLLSRRSLADTIKRLGLRAPTVSELSLAASMAFALYAVAFASDVIWQSLSPQDVYQQQNVVSQAISQSITTLTLAFLLALTAAIGEEIAFRGALQPVFGLWPTSILFAAIHLQYVLTPASVLILVVGLGFGWLRQRYNTTTSIVAHFLYDFVPPALGILTQVLSLMIRVSVR